MPLGIARAGLARRRTTGAAEFDFTTLGTCVGWWEIHTSTYLTVSGGKVTQITDRSGAGNHLVQATTANQAPLGNLINGGQALDMDGSNYKYNASGLLTPAACTIAVVGVTNNVTSLRYIAGTGASSTANNGFYFACVGNNAVRMGLSDGTTPVAKDGATVLQINTPFVALGAYDDNEVMVRANATESSITSHALGNLGTDDFWFGTNDNRTDNVLGGALGTCVIYSNMLSLANRTTLVNELAELYGL